MTSNKIRINHQISSDLIDIIRNTKEYCFIVSPYFQPWKQLMKVLELAATDEKKVIFLFRDDQYENNEIKLLNWNFDFDIFFISNLHAKIYLNEREALISSMNLYDYSKENNFEIAYKITNSSEVKDIAKDLIVGEMLKGWQSDSISGRYFNEINEGMFNPKSSRVVTRETSGKAHCVRCNAKTTYNFNKPFCNDCFSSWNQFQNAEYQEHFCHKCGKECETTKNRPLCRDCFMSSTNVLIG